MSGRAAGAHLREAMSERPMPIGVGMPAWLWLNEYGRLLRRVYGHYPYLVGSALRGKRPRDVDVRLVLPDDDWRRYVGEPGDCDRADTAWAALCLAWSALGAQMTGLPVDMQFKTVASVAPHDAEPRIHLGYVEVSIDRGGR